MSKSKRTREERLELLKEIAALTSAYVAQKPIHSITVEGEKLLTEIAKLAADLIANKQIRRLLEDETRLVGLLQQGEFLEKKWPNGVVGKPLSTN